MLTGHDIKEDDTVPYWPIFRTVTLAGTKTLPYRSHFGCTGEKSGFRPVKKRKEKK